MIQFTSCLGSLSCQGRRRVGLFFVGIKTNYTNIIIIIVRITIFVQKLLSILNSHRCYYYLNSSSIDHEASTSFYGCFEM